MQDDARLLLIPGPVSVGDDVLAALGRPVAAHYGDAWVAFYNDLRERLRAIVGTGGTVYPLFGPGTAGIEMSMASVLARGDEIVVGTTGYFGDRLATIARALGLTVHEVRSEPLRPLRREEVVEALDAHPQARAFAVVHNDTSLGLLNPIDELCTLAKERGLLTLVDAVASLGGVELQMDAWGIDLVVGTGNKALAAPVGIAVVAAGKDAWRAVDDGRPKVAGWYLNLATWREAESHEAGHPTPTTMPSSVFEALGASLDRIDREGGVAEHQARSARAAVRVRSGLKELGIEAVLPEAYAAPTVTAFWVPDGMQFADYASWLRSNHGMRIGGGLPPWEGRQFRIGHMGRAADPDVIDAYLRATGEYLETRGLHPAAPASTAG